MLAGSHGRSSLNGDRRLPKPVSRTKTSLFFDIRIAMVAREVGVCNSDVGCVQRLTREGIQMLDKSQSRIDDQRINPQTAKHTFGNASCLVIRLAMVCYCASNQRFQSKPYSK
jgi:hypothetical protein